MRGMRRSSGLTGWTIQIGPSLHLLPKAVPVLLRRHEGPIQAIDRTIREENVAAYPHAQRHSARSAVLIAGPMRLLASQRSTEQGCVESSRDQRSARSCADQDAC